MTWQQRYKLANFVKSSLWLGPVLSGILAVFCHRLAWKIDMWVHWELLGYSLESARAIIGSINSAMLTFIIFLMTMLFVALQIAVGQLTPRIIAFTFRSLACKASLAVFTFAYMFSVAAQGRLENPVPQLVVLLTIVCTVVSIGVFLFFVDFMGKSLRPISICAYLAEECTKCIESIYPLLSEESGVAPKQPEMRWDETVCTVTHEARSGIIVAFDAGGIAALAARNDCKLRMIPQVGDFVSKGDVLFTSHQGGSDIDRDQLRQSVVFGVERTIEQDPEFVFRIIVDIAIKALSPAINDPTTAVACIDQLQRLLRRVGERDLGDGVIKDAGGTVRVGFPTPNWDDFINLAMSEILHYGADSLQVIRRLRAMLNDLREQLPEKRSAEITRNLELLDRTVERSFNDPLERELAMLGDYKGIGGKRQA